jgi:hypothetical protein
VADSYNNRALMYGVLDFQLLPIFGLINFYLPPGTINTGTISIQTRDGSTRTFDILGNTKILPVGRAGQIGIGSTVTLLARHDPYSNKWIALVIVINSVGTGTDTATPTSTPTLASVPTDTPTDTPVGIPTSTPTVAPVPTDTPTDTPAGIPTSTP